MPIEKKRIKMNLDPEESGGSVEIYQRQERNSIRSKGANGVTKEEDKLELSSAKLSK